MPVFQIRNISLNSNTPDTNCNKYTFYWKPVFNGFLKVIGVKNQLPITFCLDLVCTKTLKARNSTPTHTNV